MATASFSHRHATTTPASPHPSYVSLASRRVVVAHAVLAGQSLQRQSALLERDAGAAAQILMASMVHAQMKITAQKMVDLHSGTDSLPTRSNYMPPPRLVRADVPTCFMLQAQVAALANNNAGSAPYQHLGRNGASTRFIPMPDAKGGCITLPVFGDLPIEYLDDLYHSRRA